MSNTKIKSRKKLIEQLAQIDKGKMMSVAFVKKSGQFRKITGKLVTNTPNNLGYILVKENKTGIRSVDVRTIFAIKADKKTYVCI